MTENTRCWAEISTSALAHNIQQFRTHIGGDTKLCAVIKANAYGHGAVDTAKVLIENGADFLAVATYEEAVEIRHFLGFEPILILGYIPKNFLPDALRQNFHIACYNLSLLEEITSSAKQVGTCANVHIRFDTGLTRLGFSPEDDLSPIFANEHIRVAGIFSHLSCADLDDESFSMMQSEKFTETLGKIQTNEPFLSHLTNTAGTIKFPQMHHDMVRVGLGLYGYHDTQTPTVADKTVSLKPVLSLKARVVSIREVPAGTKVSYNGIYETLQESEKIAVISAGYADGYHHALSNKAEIVIDGQRCRQTGYICMDYCMVRVPNGNNVNIGDVATLIGDGITAEELANIAGTNTYSILCGIGNRVTRIYL